MSIVEDGNDEYNVQILVWTIILDASGQSRSRRDATSGTYEGKRRRIRLLALRKHGRLSPPRRRRDTERSSSKHNQSRGDHLH